MSRYFRLSDDVAIPNRWHLGAASLSDGTEPRLRAGIRFDSTEVPRIPVTHAGRVLEFSLTSFAVPVATEKLSRAMSVVAGSDIQPIQVFIGKQTDMLVLNVLRVVRCLDETRSEFLKWTKQDHRPDLAGQYRQITRLILDAASIPPDAHSFRIDGSLIEIVVSEQLKEAMESVGCLGATFIELSLS
ncbi:MAG: DUF1629 domain-containing protein [Planctomycetota bacterium]